MARRKKEKEKVDPVERARLKKLRAAQRREERKRRKASGEDKEEPRASRKRRSPEDAPPAPLVKDDHLWIRKSLEVSYANRILNSQKQRPYWLSFRYANATVDGPLPVSHFYPCTVFRVGLRVYYGFLFREHRDVFFASLGKGRKELTCKVRSINPSVV